MLKRAPLRPRLLADNTRRLIALQTVTAGGKVATHGTNVTAGERGGESERWPVALPCRFEKQGVQEEAMAQVLLEAQRGQLDQAPPRALSLFLFLSGFLIMFPR